MNSDSLVYMKGLSYFSECKVFFFRFKINDFSKLSDVLKHIMFSYFNVIFNFIKNHVINNIL